MGLAGLHLASMLCKIFMNSFDAMGGRNSYIDNSKIRHEWRIVEIMALMVFVI